MDPLKKLALWHTKSDMKIRNQRDGLGLTLHSQKTLLNHLSKMFA